MNEVFEHIWNELQEYNPRKQRGYRPVVMIAQDTWRYMTLDPMFPEVVSLKEKRIFDEPYEIIPPGSHYDVRITNRWKMAEYHIPDIYLNRP